MFAGGNHYGGEERGVMGPFYWFVESTREREWFSDASYGATWGLCAWWCHCFVRVLILYGMAVLLGRG